MSANKAAQRQARILTQLRQHGGVRASELARTLQVSPTTIHRDLDALAGDGHLLKVHGGAVAPDLPTVSSRPGPPQAVHPRRAVP
jgi:DeoR/GlpR family transcriptional regulator of sugar metabolism